MIFFITVLRALAACLITNSHYTGIYPTDLIANGGLIGDILFFAVSGYCLYNIKFSFIKWYFKRLYRIYIPVILITVIFIITGCYSLDDMSVVEYFIYPTFYHFVASIIILYIPYYIVLKTDFLKQRIGMVMIIVALIMLFVYVIFYDKSYYHIDNVKEPFIRFIFFESMLLGAHFRQKDDYYRNKSSLSLPILTIMLFVIYFVSKLAFSRIDTLAEIQIINQYVIFILLYMIFRTFASIDNKLDNMPKHIKSVITFLAEITLEIYVVQYALITIFRPIFGFPINWIIITAVIVISAFVLHILCRAIYGIIDKIIKSIKE